MGDIRAYVLSVTAAAILCGLVNVLIGKTGTVAALTKLLTGVVLAAAVLRPLGGLAIGDLDAYLQSLDMDAQAAAAVGTEMTREAMAARIKEQTEAYILDKAASLQMDVTVEVILDDGDMPVPVGVILTGSASPYAKSTLESMISEELGIPKEEQKWT